jgi:hypothetical protein
VAKLTRGLGQLSIALALPALRTQIMVRNSMADAAPATWTPGPIDVDNQAPPTLAELQFHVQVPRSSNSTGVRVIRRRQQRLSRSAEDS